MEHTLDPKEALLQSSNLKPKGREHAHTEIPRSGYSWRHPVTRREEMLMLLADRGAAFSLG